METNDLDLLRLEQLEPWLDMHVPEIGDGPLDVRALPGGKSNCVFRISRGAATAVLRRPPRYPRPNSNTVIAREALVLGALKHTDVPHPRMFAACDDHDIIGVNFYVMAYVDGWSGFDLSKRPARYADVTGEAYRNVPFAFIDGIAKLCRIDYRKVGLEGFGKPEKFLERQVDRWLSQLESYKQSDGYEGRAIEGLDYVADWLRANRPETKYLGIMHGDYNLGNALFPFSAPPRLLAVLDWEMATIGDTLLDLGWALFTFRGKDGVGPDPGYYDAANFPCREELADYYSDRTGHAVDDLNYYIVLAQFKLASIMEGHVARAQAGKQTYDARDFVDRLIASAEALARNAS